MRKFLLFLIVFGAVLLFTTAQAEPAISFQPENPRMGDYVDVTVISDREGAQSITWSLSTPEGEVFAGKETDHFVASFRPRQEAEYTLTVTVSYGKKDTESASVVIPVSGTAPVQEGPDVVYSQKDGWWKDKMYSTKYHRSVQKAGCALFALSHALQRLGKSGEEVQPDQLAVRFKSCYVEEHGTANEILLSRAGEIWGFSTANDLIGTELGIRTCFALGDRFSFSIVNGHIGYADALSEDGTKVHVIDSAPSATYERLKNGSVYYLDANGAFVEAKTPDELPGIRWFFETGEYGGMEYWMDLSYCARRGMRLIRPPWLTLSGEEDGVSLTLDYVGTVWSSVTVGGESRLVRTRDLNWVCAGTDGMKIARVTRKNTPLNDDAGKRVPRIKLLQPGALVAVLADADKKQVYVYYKGAFGYLPKANVELLDVDPGDYPAGLVSVNGKTRGTAEVNIRVDTSKKQSYYTWVVGTPVTVLKEKGDYLYAEGGGLCGWIKNDYFTPDASGDPE